MQTNARRRRKTELVSWPARPQRSYPHGHVTGMRQLWQSQCGRFQIHYFARTLGRYVLWIKNRAGHHISTNPDFSTLGRAKAAAMDIARGYRIIQRSQGEVRRFFPEIWNRATSLTGVGKWEFIQTGASSRADAVLIARNEIARRMHLASSARSVQSVMGGGA